MQDYQRQFIEFALQNNVLRFGEFTLKSGRVSPYFFNIGGFKSGAVLAELGKYYAEAIQASGIEFDVLFGPAYKGIPLACSAAIAMQQEFNIDVPYCFNRKVVKDHGEGGTFVGASLEGRVLIIDDVISAGTTFREMVTLFENESAEIVGVLTALDRSERGTSSKTATQELTDDFHIQFSSIIHIDHVVQYLAEQPSMASELKRMKEYRAEYGVLT